MKPYMYWPPVKFYYVGRCDLPPRRVPGEAGPAPGCYTKGSAEEGRWMFHIPKYNAYYVPLDDLQRA